MMVEVVIWGSLGLIVGSFVNVLILRHGTKSILGRSHCPKCGNQLKWFELIPVISWLFLRGKCGSCKARISIQYPLVELLVAGGFLGVGLAPAPLIVKIIAAPIIALLVAILVYDLYHTIIPDRWSYPLAALALVSGLVSPLVVDTWYVALLAGPAVALPLFMLWHVSKGTWMGFGDVKLALGIGWLLGILHGYIALMFAFFIGAIVGVFVLLPLQRVRKILEKAGPVRGEASNGAGITPSSEEGEGYTMKSEVPFGPFLICALCIVWFSQLYGVALVPILMDILVFS